MKKVTNLVLTALLAGLIISACAEKEEAVKEKEIKVEVDPAAELAKSVENGMNLFADASLGTSGMTCNSCHTEGGTKDGKMGDMAFPAFEDVASKYPKYFGMAKKVMTVSQVNNWCIVNPMKGQALSWDDQRLTNLTAYVASVKGKSEVKKKLDPKATAALAGSVENGKKLFADAGLGTSGMTCNSCHLEGGTKEGKMGEMAIPPFANLGTKYPKYFGMAKNVMTLSQVNNWCILNPLKGQPLSWDDQKLADLTAYVASVKAEPEE